MDIRPLQIDAEKHDKIEVLRRHIEEAIRKTTEACGGNRYRNIGCGLEIGFLDGHQEYCSCRADKTVFNAELADGSAVHRWILEADGKVLADFNDSQTGMEALLAIPEENWPLVFNLISPIAIISGEGEEAKMKRYTRSLAFGRSEKGRQVKRESAANREGQERGSYEKPSGKYRDGRTMRGYYTKKKVDDEYDT